MYFVKVVLSYLLLFKERLCLYLKTLNPVTLVLIIVLRCYHCRFINKVFLTVFDSYETSLNNRQKRYSTELSKNIWNLTDNKKKYNLK